MGSVMHKVLFLVPRTHKPELPHFSWKYSSLPENVIGHVVMPASDEYENMKMGSSLLHTIRIVSKEAKFKNIVTAINLIYKSLQIFKKEKYDVIVSYDPLTLGLVGTVLKYITKARLVIEMNGHLTTAAFIGNYNYKSHIKKNIYKIIINMCIKNADCIKFINNVLAEEYKTLLKRKKYYVFGDYVPDEYFKKSNIDNKYIFFAGYPYYIKGVDILIKAFKRLANDYPDYRLKIMGFNNVDLDKYKFMAGECGQIEFLQPVFYDQIVKYFENCTFFVLPSRTEAMGRVLIEAMSCGKAVIASNVGGIPEVVENDVTGYLFESENVEELEYSMRKLLSNPELRMRMGNAGYEKMKMQHSSCIYVDKFTAMIESICPNVS
jgi:glycosyltransferase involved in cell wall biosynthesis